ncbi:MAG: prephenate dehydrogenase/arogenate dehydrogenase family protein [Ruminococcus sp.]
MHAFGSCDYVFLCVPVEINLECLAYLKEIRQPGCIITDVGSVKGIIHQKVDELGMTDCFIGGHPIAGSEKNRFRPFQRAHSGKCILYSYSGRRSGTGIYFRFYRTDQFSWCYPYGAYS